MEKNDETEAIIKWLRRVDKPLATKERDEKAAEPRDKMNKAEIKHSMQENVL